MRISSTLFFKTGLNSINAQQADLMHLYQQVGSGQRMVTPADDPLAAAQTINISQGQSMNLRLADNREVLKNNLGTEENVLNSVTKLMQDIKTTLVEAGNGTYSDASRATLATVLQSAKDSMLGLANSTDGNGQFIFSGFAGTQQAFTVDTTTGKVSYNGDDGQRLIQADQTREIAGNDIGSTIFTQSVKGSRVYVTAADAGNAGTGLISTPTITNPKGVDVGKSFQIQFSQSAVPGAVLEYTVSAPGMTPLTKTYEAGTTHLDLGDGVQVAFSGDPTDGDVFTVDPAASSADLSVFDSLDSIILALNTPVGDDEFAKAKLANTLAGVMQRIDINYDQVLTVRASVGTRLAEIDSIQANGALRALSYDSQLSKLEDVDYYSASAQLQLRTAALEAAALAFKKIQATSLFTMSAR